MATFPPIYVISLKHTPERRLHIQRQLDALHLKYEFVDVDDIDKYEMESKVYRMRIAQSLGIDESLLENKYAAIVNHAKTQENKSWKNDNLGQIAIILSHIRIYDLMVKDGIDRACILEDDATLLSTFPEVLKIALELQWDILLLASQPTGFWHSNLLRRKRFRYFVFKEFIKYLWPFNFRINNSNNSKQRVYQIKNLLENYGIDPHPKQLEGVMKKIEEHYINKENITKAAMADNLPLFFIKYRSCKKSYGELFNALDIHTSMQFGALPEKSSLESITEHHRIAEPKYTPYSTAAYLVNQSTAMKWKRSALASDISPIDQIPWRLYKNEQVKLRIVTPPCATSTYGYFKYSVRRR